MHDTIFRLVVGERGNEQGHIVPTRAMTERGARRAIARALRSYGQDGWGRVEMNCQGKGETTWQRI